MIPAGGFLLGEAPSFSRPPVYLLPAMVTRSFKGGAENFTPEERVPPFGIAALSKGAFEAAIVSGHEQGAFGYRVELRRTGIYGTILVDRVDFDIATIKLLVEGCPDTTEESEEASVPVVLTSAEACPHVTVPTVETSTPILVIDDDY